MDNKIKEAIEANIQVHSAMADQYNTVEPHFRPESIKRVDDIINGIAAEMPVEKALDLGCGTGFMINIVKNHAKEIVGVDVTQAMLDKVNLEGNASIRLINHDTGTVELPAEYFDLATAYTFLDHLYDMRPTFANTFKALKKGGVFYADLSPNFYFWDAIKQLDRSVQHDPIIQREIDAVYDKDAEIEAQFGVNKEVFKAAERQKHEKGGLVEEEVRSLLLEVGFSKVEFIYHWFVGQAQLINNDQMEKEQRFGHAAVMHDYLVKALPVSRSLFKYVGFKATK